MTIVFRTATSKDTKLLLDFYAQAVKDLAETANLCLWREDLYPIESDILPPLKAGEFILAEEAGDDGNVADTDNAGAAGSTERHGTLLAAAVLNSKSHPDYAQLDWRGNDWRAIHLLCVDQSARNRGIANHLVEELVARAKADGADSMRLDLLIQNEPARRLYAKHGFQSRGVLDLQYENEEPLTSELMELVFPA